MNMTTEIAAQRLTQIEGVQVVCESDDSTEITLVDSNCRTIRMTSTEAKKLALKPPRSFNALYRQRQH